MTRSYHQNPTDSYEHYQRLEDITRELILWNDIPSSWAAIENISASTSSIQTMAQHFEKADEIAEKLLKRWDKSFLDMEAVPVLRNIAQTETKWSLGKTFGLSRIVRSLSAYSLGKVDKQTIKQDLEFLAQYQEEKKAGNELLTIYGIGLGDLFCGDETDWNKVYWRATKAKSSAERLDETFHVKKIRQLCAGDRTLDETYKSFLASKAEMEKERANLYTLLSIQESPNVTDLIASELMLCESIESNSDDIKEWITWNAISAETVEKGAGVVVTAYEAGMDHDDVIPAFKRAVYQAMAIYAIDNSPVLNTFSGTVFNEKIEQFKKIDRDYTELTKQEIFCRLASHIPNFSKEAAQSSELGILQRAIRSNARGTSIRRLLDQLPEILVRLCPCMLMSPISAAQYLDPKRKPFDIVVFDEASQLPTCKAVGALARGENAVIVGDPKQMPPTSFFQTNSIDEENLELEDLESILDDCLAINMPQTHLLWHYRSRHESLIAFSNSQFYENKLYTFPSVNDRATKVQLVHVDGIFTRGRARINKEEAAAIINDLKHRAHDPVLSRYSVGVVTFNATQQNYIEDMLNEACADDADLERWAYESEEPLFIKNLENVQGDERDIILFSIGYGPDENGKIYMNFGPLNREGA